MIGYLLSGAFIYWVTDYWTAIIIMCTCFIVESIEKNKRPCRCEEE